MLLAHAFGARYDLPIPLWMFLLGAGAVVAMSFGLVARWEVEQARLAGLDGEVPLRGGAVRGALSIVVVLLLAAAGVYGNQEVAENILPTSFWLLAWIAVPISCGLIGDWTQAWNPFAVVARAADRDWLRERLIAYPDVARWPEWLGWWPATLIFFVVASGELIYNGTATAPIVTALAIVVYGLVSAAGGLLFGAETWLAKGEMFSVLFATWGRLGCWRFGAPGRTGPLGGIDQPFEAVPSRITFVLLMLMSVTFDGILSSPLWRDLKSLLPANSQPGSTGYVLVGVAAFASLLGLAWLVFLGCAWAVRAAGAEEGSVTDMLANLLPSLLPIAFGYLIAHNFDYLVINGQLLIPLAGNPTGRAQWLPAPFDDSYEVNKNIVPSAFVWYLQIVVIVAVHIAAVVIAHRHLARAAGDRRSARRSELPWLVAMVAYTMTSLWLLAQPIVEEHKAKASAPAAGAVHAEAPASSRPSPWGLS